MPECPDYVLHPGRPDSITSGDYLADPCTERGGNYVGGHGDIEANGGAQLTLTWPAGRYRVDPLGSPFFEETLTEFPAGTDQGQSMWDLLVVGKGEPSVCWWHGSVGIGDPSEWRMYDNTDTNTGVNLWVKFPDATDWSPGSDFGWTLGQVEDPPGTVVAGATSWAGVQPGQVIQFAWSDTFMNPPGYDPGVPPPEGCAGWDAPLTTAMFVFIWRKRAYRPFPPLLGPTTGYVWPISAAPEPPPPPQGGVHIHFWGQESSGSWGRPSASNPDQNPQWDTPPPETPDIGWAVPATWLPFDASAVVDMAPQASFGYGVLAVLADGTVWQWGEEPSSGLEIAPEVVPLPGPAVGVSGGGSGNMVTLADGSVYEWGANPSGRLGFSGSGSPTPIPHPAGNAIQATIDAQTTLVLQSDGTVQESGRGAGMADSVKASVNATPVRRSPAPHYGVGPVARLNRGGGYAWTVTALMQDGTLLSWGHGDHQEIGNGSASQYQDIHGFTHGGSSAEAPNEYTDQPDTYGYFFWNWPQAVKGIDGEAILSGVVDFAMQDSRGIALLGDGRLACWGHGTGPMMDDSLAPSWLGLPSDAPTPWRLPDPPSPALEVAIVRNAYVVRCEDGGVYVIHSYQSTAPDAISGHDDFHPAWRRLPGVVQAVMLRGGADLLMILGQPEAAVDDFVWVSSQLG